MVQSFEVSLESGCPIKDYFSRRVASRDIIVWTEMMCITSRPRLLRRYCTFSPFPMSLAGCRRCQSLWVEELHHRSSLGQNHLIKETSTNKELLLWITTLVRNKLLLCLRYILWNLSVRASIIPPAHVFGYVKGKHCHSWSSGAVSRPECD